ncbi:MAG: alanine racemase [Solirubrobacterales bacterium]|nr:alanine racemase [Solirubrobacterales bacterium]
MSAHEPFQRAMAVVDLGAIERNCSHLKLGLQGNAELCAVVKSNGYGHGMAECAEAAMRGGASRLAVATATEAFELRSRLPEAPILVMGALTGAELDVAMQARAEIAVWRMGFLAEISERAAMFGFRPRVHVKYDTGMGRLGDRDPRVIEALVDDAAADERVELGGLWTHFATADEDDESFLREQLQRFREVAVPAKERHPGITLHAANSAATLRGADFHFDMVRCGVAIYGLDPFGEDASSHGLQPAMSLHGYLAEVKAALAGDSVGYGRTWTAESDTLVGVIPVGYGDGYRRGLSNRADVLVDGHRVPGVGTISMDNLTVDLGPGSEIEMGAPVVLLGAQGEDEIAAEELAERLGTINYEITCGISLRVPRAYRR